MALASTYPGGPAAISALGRRLREEMASCCLCPRACRVDRRAGEIGACGVGADAVVASAGPHFGEEAPLVGRSGSGTIFLSGCNLGCLFCQNDDISHGRSGRPLSAAGLAELMLQLQRQGCHNVNFVTPTHQVPAIVEALALAVEEGFSLPLVYNCGGYDSVAVLRRLAGLVDIYMPDMKYADDEVGRRLSGVPDYWTVCRAAVTEMHRQVGDLVCDEDGVACRGLLVRHLVLPHGLAGTGAVMAFLAGLSAASFVNVMGQYRPCHRAADVPDIARRPTAAEIEEARSMARDLNLTRGLTER